MEPLKPGLILDSRKKLALNIHVRARGHLTMGPLKGIELFLSDEVLRRQETDDEIIGDQ
jgi:hypothetical protein